MNSAEIFELRRRLGESQTNFGARFQVSQIAVAHWESGRSQPSPQRLRDLVALVGAGAAIKPAEPFRPIQYLGSKQRLAETIFTVIEETAPDHSRVGDLFAGSGVVSSVLGIKRPVTTVDVQAYSRVLSEALLLGRPEDFAALLSPQLLHRVEEVFSQLSNSLAPLLDFELEVLSRAVSGDADPLSLLIEQGSIAAYEQRASAGGGGEMTKLIRDAATQLGRMKFSAGDLTATRYFGGPYFSYRQAIALDAIYIAIQSAPKKSTVRCALAVLLSTASEIVNTVGKQFAQPMKLKKADGKIPPILLERALRDRNLDVCDTFRGWAARWKERALGGNHKHKTVCGDVIDFVSSDRECRAYYADPPYTIDHYSRFYHVLETLSLRDSPCLGEMKRGGRYVVMRGIYRSDRYQSPFCIPSLAPAAFDGLLAATAGRRAPLVLSYSPFDEEKGDRPRLLTLTELTEIAGRHYRKVGVTEITDHSHRKLNAKALNVDIRPDAERLIVCEAAK